MEFTADFEVESSKRKSLKKSKKIKRSESMKLLTKKELANKLKCSVTSVYRLRIKYKDFPSPFSFGDSLAGSKIFFDEDEIDAWLVSNKHKLRTNASCRIS